MRYPNLFLAGAPKCGTTSLVSYLAQHSDVFVPIVKEPIYFGADLHASGTRRTKVSYLGLYDAWTDERYGLDGSTHYFYSTGAAGEIAAVAPEARIIMMVRNPIDATYSMFHQLRFNGTEEFDDFADFLDAEPARAAGLVEPKFGFAENFLYSRIYGFTDNIRRFEAAFGAERTQVVFLEDLKEDPATVMRDVCGFLEIAANEVDGFTFDVQNTAKRARFRFLNTLAVYPPSWLGYLSKPLLSQNARTRLRNKIGAMNTRPAKNPPMEPDLRQRLARHFQPEIEKLSKHLDRDLSHWA